MKSIPSYRISASGVYLTVTGSSALRTLLAVGGDWLLIGVSAIFSLYFSSSWLAYLAAILVIASRQHGLLVLMHEGAHGHLFRAKSWNDRLGNALTSWPFGMSLERYREHHWKHHQFTNTEKDPDWGRKVELASWRFPKTATRFWADFLPYFKGLGLKEMWFAFRVIGVRPSSLAAFYYLAAAGILTATHAWPFFFQYWVVPYLAILPVLMKVRSIVEHLALPHTSELTASRNIVGTPVQSFFFGPHGNSLHLIHHLYPQIPWFNLGKMRVALRDDDLFRREASENHGYFFHPQSAYQNLVTCPRPEAQDKAA